MNIQCFLSRNLHTTSSKNYIKSSFSRDLSAVRVLLPIFLACIGTRVCEICCAPKRIHEDPRGASQEILHPLFESVIRKRSQVMSLSIRRKQFQCSSREAYMPPIKDIRQVGTQHGTLGPRKCICLLKFNLKKIPVETKYHLLLYRLTDKQLTATLLSSSLDRFVYRRDNSYRTYVDISFVSFLRICELIEWWLVCKLQVHLSLLIFKALIFVLIKE